MRWKSMRRRRDERGATAALIAMLMSAVLVIAAAFAVDLGQQRVVRADVQAVADVVALDMARHLDGSSVAADYGCSGGGATCALDTARLESLSRNASALGGELDGADLTWGFYKRVADDWVEVAKGATGPTDIPTAIWVRAESDTSFAFAPVIGDDFLRGGAVRTAVASKSDPSACVSVGTKTLTLDTSGSVLAPLLEDMLNLLDLDLDVIGYEGIVNLKNLAIPLADVLVELNIGNTNELASANIGLRDFTLAMAKVAERTGNTASAMILQAISVDIENLDINLGEILSLASGQETSGLGADINALDLLGVAAYAATGEHALELDLPGYLSLTAIEPPQIACGRSGDGVSAKSAQIRLGVDIPNVLAALDNLGLTAPAYLLEASARLDVEVGYATARIDEIECAGGRIRLQVDTGAASATTVPNHIHLAITLNRFFNVLGPLVGGLLKLALTPLLGPSVGLEVEASAYVASSGTNRWITYPEAPAVPAPVRFPQADSERDTLRLGNASVQLLESASVLGLLAGILNPVLDGLLSGVVTPLLNDVLSPLLNALVTPVLGLLGIGLGVADVSVGARPACQNVKLVG